MVLKFTILNWASLTTTMWHMGASGKDFDPFQIHFADLDQGTKLERINTRDLSAALIQLSGCLDLVQFGDNQVEGLHM
jgi:hypothetical protein